MGYDTVADHTLREFKRRAELFPSLSLMQSPARGFSTDAGPTPAPVGAPRPRIRNMSGTYRCRSEEGRVVVEGFGDTALRAWNAWVGRIEIAMKKNGTTS